MQLPNITCTIWVHFWAYCLLLFVQYQILGPNSTKLQSYKAQKNKNSTSTISNSIMVLLAWLALHLEPTEPKNLVLDFLSIMSYKKNNVIKDKDLKPHLSFPSLHHWTSKVQTLFNIF